MVKDDVVNEWKTVKIPSGHLASESIIDDSFGGCFPIVQQSQFLWGTWLEGAMVTSVAMKSLPLCRILFSHPCPLSLYCPLIKG